jgi:hypothetical protein
VLARKNFKNARDYDVLVSSPELYKKYSNVRDSQSVQLNNLMPTTKSSGLNEKEILENLLVQKILRPEGDEQVHHKNALSLIGIALDNADDAGKAQIYNLLEHNGIDIGDSIYNLINLPKAVHEDHHRFTRDQGLEMQGKGTKGLAKKLQESTNLDSTLEYLQDYIDYGVPLIRENIDDLMTSYTQKGAKRFAGEDPKVREYMQAIESGRDTQSTGAVSGDKPVVVHAGEGSRVFLQTNGNGPADMQRTFRMFDQ